MIDVRKLPPDSGPQVRRVRASRFMPRLAPLESDAASQYPGCRDVRCTGCGGRRVNARYWPYVFAGRFRDRWRLSCCDCLARWHSDHEPEAAR